MIRQAHPGDIEALISIENAAFDTDRFSRRSFRYLLTKANALTLVDENQDIVRGYATLLFHTGTSLARLYSIAVDPRWTHAGIGRSLLSAAEEQALHRDCVYVRLEVRSDNAPARELYQNMGYKKIGIIPEYYEDAMEATRYEKYLPSGRRPDITTVTFYQQTLDFTCGPSSLMMAMHSLDRSFVMDRKTELRIWREATTIFMTSGHGGCSPHGLALSAHRRGFNTTLYINEDPFAFMVDTVRSLEKKEVMKLVQEDFIAEVKRQHLKVVGRSLSLSEMETHVKKGRIPIILISSYRMYREKFPHWIVVTGFDDKYVYCHDPYIDYEKEKTPIDSINMPILKKDFEKMSRFGKSGQKAAIIIYK
jgi:ribosomal-protein-alanine acetyltransferase